MPKIKANGLEFYYEMEGEGPPLVMIMGLGGSARMWYRLIPLLSDKFKVITFDNRDAGRTEKSPEDDSTELFAADTKALFEAWDIDKAHVFGISMGGMIAQKLAVLYPEIIDRLILGCTLPNFHYAPPEKEVAFSMRDMVKLPPDKRLQAMAKLLVTPSFMESEPKEMEYLYELIRYDQKDQGLPGFLRQLNACARHDTAEEAERIGHRTMVLTGDADILVPPANSKFLTEKVKGSRLKIIPGANHAFFVEKPKESAELIREFLLS